MFQIHGTAPKSIFELFYSNLHKNVQIVFDTNISLLMSMISLGCLLYSWQVLQPMKMKFNLNFCSIYKAIFHFDNLGDSIMCVSIMQLFFLFWVLNEKCFFAHFHLPSYYASHLLWYCILNLLHSSFVWIQLLFECYTCSIVLGICPKIKAKEWLQKHTVFLKITMQCVWYYVIHCPLQVP